MAVGGKQAAQGDGPAVKGRRLSFWQALDVGTVIITIGVPVALLASAYHVVEVVRGNSAVFSVSTAGYVVLAIVALIFLGLVRGTLRAIVIESACPRCGFERVRSFGAYGTEDPMPQPCGECIAYLCTDGEFVRELAPNASQFYPCFDVKKERYLPALQRDAKGHCTIPMPDLCAVCGSALATSRRDIDFPRGTDFGIVGSVAKEYVRTKRAGSPVSGWGSYTSSGPTDEIDFLGMQIPVCAQHTQHADPSNKGAAYETDGLLRFQNYGFYKQFLALNHIDGTVGQAAPTSGSPR